MSEMTLEQMFEAALNHPNTKMMTPTERDWYLFLAGAGTSNKIAATKAQTVDVDTQSIREVIHQLRMYNPKADEYAGKYIHASWALSLESSLPSHIIEDK